MFLLHDFLPGGCTTGTAKHQHFLTGRGSENGYRNLAQRVHRMDESQTQAKN